MGANRPRWVSLDVLAFALAILTGLLVIGGIWLATSFRDQQAAIATAITQQAHSQAMALGQQEEMHNAAEMAYLLSVLQAQRAIEGGRPEVARERLAAAVAAREQSDPAGQATGDESRSIPEFEWRWLDRKLKAAGSEILARGAEPGGAMPEKPAASLAFAADGRSIALGLPDGAIVLRALPGGDSRWGTKGGKHPIVGVAFSPDGKLIASADRGGGVLLLNAATGEDAHPPLSIDQRDPRGPAFGKDGTIHFLGAPLASAKPGEPPSMHPGEEETAWAATDGNLTQFLLTDGNGQLRLAPLPLDPGTGDMLVPTGTPPPRCAAASPDGRLLALSYRDQGRLYLHRRLPNAMQGGSRGTGVEVTALAFSPDGSRLAVGDEQGGVALWAPNPICETLAFPPLAGPGEEPAAIVGVAFSPDGNSLGAIDARGRWIVWDGAP